MDKRHSVSKNGTEYFCPDPPQDRSILSRLIIGQVVQVLMGF